MTVTAGEAEALAARITRHLILPIASRSTVRELADRLLGLRQHVPSGDCLLLGGSLARGEPAIIPTGRDTWKLASDLDLLLVHATPLPQCSASQLVYRARGELPTITVMTVSAAEYRRLRTSLGHEFKDLGIVLVGRAPACDPVTVDARDAFELLLYAVQAWFWEGLASAWAAGTAGFDISVNRLCLKVLRACVLLAGGNRCGDPNGVAEPLRVGLRAELAWRADPRQAALDPARWWPLVTAALGVFDQQMGTMPDALTATPYQYRPGAAAVAEQQRIAHALARRIPQLLPIGPVDAAAVLSAQRTAWQDLVDQCLVRSAASAEEHFAQRVQAIREDMLWFKTAPDHAPTPPWPWPQTAAYPLA